MSAEHGLDESRRIPLLALALPSALVVACWLVETTAIFPTGSRGAGLIALGLIGGSILSVWPIFVIVRRLIYAPATRRWPHFALLLVSVVTLVPAVTFVAALLMGL